MFRLCVQWLLAMVLIAASSGCVTGDQRMATDSFVDGLQDDDVVVFVGAHPDDETLVGPLLAYSAERCREVVVVSLTKGESGWNLAKEDLTRTLAEVRAEEFDSAVRTLGATPVTFDYVNGVSKAHPDGLAVLDEEETAVRRWRSPGGREQGADVAYERWARECGDPAQALSDLFCEKGATHVIALDPENGYTNHQEHVAATRAAVAAVRQCNRERGRRISLYYVVRPSDATEDAELVTTDDLNASGDKDYGGIARKSRAFYVSQFRFDDAQPKPVTDKCLVRADDVD